MEHTVYQTSICRCRFQQSFIVLAWPTTNTTNTSNMYTCYICCCHRPTNSQMMKCIQVQQSPFFLFRSIEKNFRVCQNFPLRNIAFMIPKLSPPSTFGRPLRNHNSSIADECESTGVRTYKHALHICIGSHI